jgi:hypothetical protein
MDWISWTINISVGLYVLSLVWPIGLRALRMRWGRDGFLLLLLMIGLGALGHPPATALASLALAAGSVWMMVRSYRLSSRLKKAWLRRWRTGGGIVLEPPFQGRWKASGCGPDAAKNHHLAAPDQWFAVDFIRVDGKSLGSEILSPVDGAVAAVEDGHADLVLRGWRGKRNVRAPAGNYVALEVKSGEAAGAAAFVLLCHLQKGSLRVRVGDLVRVGDVVGLCGNSGNTSAPHLHVHVQDRPSIAVGVAKGLPMRFAGHEDWLEVGAILNA